MDDRSWPDLITDRGDDSYMVEGAYNDYLQGIGLEAPNTRIQTPSAYVSPFGRELSQSHFQQNKEASGNNPMFWSTTPTTNAHPRFLGPANADPRNRHAPWQDYDGTSVNQFGTYLNVHDGLPDPNWGDPNNLPVLGEPLECDHVRPTPTYSSFSSSATSDEMGSLSLAPVNGRGGTRRDSRMKDPSAWDYAPTISPSQLRINPSPIPNSSSESVHTTLLTSNNPELGPHPGLDQPRQHNVPRSKHPGHQSRRELPRHGRLASLGVDSSANRPPPPPHQVPSQKEVAPQPNMGQLRPRPKGPAPPGGPKSNALTSQIAERAAKDELLIRLKEEGLSYREIRQQGNFKEAESTLRGRWRTLTKAKEERKRKPEWQENDVHLLRKAVHKQARGRDLATAKISWKDVAKYIVDHGGSYLFGNATCRKRWDDLVEQGQAY